MISRLRRRADGGRKDTVSGPTAAELAAARWRLPRSLDPARNGKGAGWTLVGTAGSARATPVDAGGAVGGEGWTLDWAVGADDRWHLPAQEASVRQLLVEGTPVVETLLRVPGGDAVHRAYGARDAAGTEHVVVEVENRTSIPFALALVVRPIGLDGRGSAQRITVDAAGYDPGAQAPHVVRIDGRAVLLLPRRPARSAVGSHAEGDPMELVMAGAAASGLGEALCDSGWASTALVLPLVHTAVLRVLLPIDAVDPSDGVDDPLRDQAPAVPQGLPESAAVVAGWQAQTAAVRISVPEARLAAAFDAGRSALLLADHGVGPVDAAGQGLDRVDGMATALLLGALDET
ncbi:MAG TPA: hypothetical protein VGM93_13140, partial [Acidimicrobiales bacterium]